jgi:hypothetical protein
MVRPSIVKVRHFNAFQLGPETPTAPGRGEKTAFGERCGRSFRSQSPECAAQTLGKLGVFQTVSPRKSGSPPAWWRRIGNWKRKVSVRQEPRPRYNAEWLIEKNGRLSPVDASAARLDTPLRRAA